MSDDEIKAICLAEFDYWQQQDGDDTAQRISLGATGAASNILAAVNGRPAPWHPKPARSGRSWLVWLGWYLLEVGLVLLTVALLERLTTRTVEWCIVMAVFVRLAAVLAEVRRKGVL